MQHGAAVIPRRVVAKACDACRRRKTRCSGQQPCVGCRAAKLVCTFKSPRGQGGNQGPRATVLNKLRASQNQDQGDVDCNSSSSSVHNHEPALELIGSSFNREDGIKCINLYLKHIRHVVPIITEEVLWAELELVYTKPLSLQLISCFCAFVVCFGQLPNDDRTKLPERDGVAFIQAAAATRDVVGASLPEPHDAHIAFFMYGAFAGLGDYQRAWLYLRVATTIYIMLKAGVHPWYDEEAHRRFFWILVVSERSEQDHGRRPEL